VIEVHVYGLLTLAALYLQRRIMTCHCWHIIGESYLCREHGGGDCWSAGAKRFKNRIPEPFPPEAEGNWNHPYWDFLDKTDMRKLNQDVPLGQMIFGEIIP
jgi:hypothetical protein